MVIFLSQFLGKWELSQRMWFPSHQGKNTTFSNLNSYSDTTFALRKGLRNFLCMSPEAKEVRRDCSACNKTLMSPNNWSSFFYSLIYRLIQIIAKRGNPEHFMTSCTVQAKNFSYSCPVLWEVTLYLQRTKRKHIKMYYYGTMNNWMILTIQSSSHLICKCLKDKPIDNKT